MPVAIWCALTKFSLVRPHATARVCMVEVHQIECRTDDRRNLMSPPLSLEPTLGAGTEVSTLGTADEDFRAGVVADARWRAFASSDASRRRTVCDRLHVRASMLW